MTTKPFLYISTDLEKSWREDLHPRDKYGKFSTVKGGSRVVTKTGKTGVVESVTDSHYHVRYDDGKKGKVVRDSAIHEKDHKKVVEAQKKAKKRSTAAKKAAPKATATKAQKKADGTKAATTPTPHTAPKKATAKTSKTTAAATKTVTKKTSTAAQKKADGHVATKTTKTAKPAAAKTAKPAATKTAKPAATKTAKPKTPKQVQAEKVKDMKKKASEARKRNLAAKKERDLSAPAIAGGHIQDPGAPATPARKKENDKQNAEVAAVKQADQKMTPGTLEEMWNHPSVQSLMSKPADQRSAEDIKRIAGEMTNENDKLARKLVLKMGAARGLNLAAQKNVIGANSKNPISEGQETNHYGDMLQTARATMYETLHNVMAGSQNPAEGTSIGSHVVRRMRDKVHQGMYDLMNDIPAPHAIRQAMADKQRHEGELSQALGRTPTKKELAEHLMKNSKHFKEAAIMEAPYWDDKSNDWVASNKPVKDPERRLQLLENYSKQQKTISADTHIGSVKRQEVTVAPNIADEARTPEQALERKERQKELEGALPKAMRAMGMSDASILAYKHMYSSPSSKTSKPQLTAQETADSINAAGGYNGAQISDKWVDKHIRAGKRVIAEAIASNHPAIAQLKLLKSFVFTMILKAMYEYDLVKSIHAWGLDTSIIRQEFVRTTSGDSLFEIRKSLEPTEYVGAYVTTDTGEVHARIVELGVQGGEELQKSFFELGRGLRKSLFPHKGNSNHAVNQKATDYIKANKEKYTSMSDSQQSAAKKKGGNLTWSEQLLVENQGSAWITWGGKRILVNVGSGAVLFDSRNDAHRDEQANGVQEDKLEFHHEKDELDTHHADKEAAARKEWEEGAKDKKGNSMNRWLNANNAKLDEHGNLTFDRGDSTHAVDHGVQAFKEEQEKLQEDWKPQKSEMAQRHKHKTVGMYHAFSDEDKQAYEGMNEDARKQFVGQHIANQEGVKDLLQTAHDKLANGASAEDVWNEHEADFKALGKQHSSMALQNKKYMQRFLKNHLHGSNMDEDKLHNGLGGYEFQRAGEEANKRMMDEGAYHVGNPVNGKNYVIKVTHKLDPQKKTYTTDVSEVFDPETGQHLSIQGWGQLGKAMGMNPSTIQEDIVQNGNKDVNSPMVKKVADEDYQKLRKNTKLGLQEDMTHKDFKLVDQKRDGDNKITKQTFAQDMPDGTQNVIEVDGKGYIKDPIMARVIKQSKPIKNAQDLHDVLKEAVGNRAWVTAHAGSDVHIGNALGHHIQLEYDGKGAPRVVSGAYAGYRFMDSKDIPKGAIDPTTGEPIKALFKNGKLVDRKFTTKNNVEMKEGNAVHFQDGDGKWKKGKIIASEGNNHQVKDSQGNLVGWHAASDLKHAKEEGRALSKSGQAVVRLGKTGKHRMNTEEIFGAPHKGEDLSKKQLRENAKAERVKQAFADALRKAKINTDAFDKDGNLHKDIELNDGQHKRLQKVLGRSKAGREMLSKFNSAYTKDLEIHVPEHMKEQVAAEGVTVGNDGIAKISAAKFEHLRNVLGGLSMDKAAQDHLSEHFKNKDRERKSPAQLKKRYQASEVPGAFGDLYRRKFKEGSFLLDPDKGLYGTQLEGLSHLVERGRALVGHSMGVGKTITGVAAAMHYKSQMELAGKKPKKTLIVAPKGIMSDWGKEIGSHTNSKALYIGSNMTKKGADGKKMKHDNGRNMWGQDGTEQEAVDFKSFKANTDKHASEDHDFHVINYDTFMKNREHFANSGMYDNIVIDEVHAFKNQKGQRGASLAETTDRFKNVWGLSGTPMENDAREIYSLIDTIRGGKHELGSEKEFRDNYMIKDRTGKIVGVKPEKARELGDILANVVQFRSGEDVTYNDGSKIHFPHLVGASDPNNPNPHMDFIGNMADGSRDHGTNAYYGTKHSVTDFQEQQHTVSGGDGEAEKTSTTFQPKNLDASTQRMYSTYNELQSKYLPDSKLQELASASATGYDTGKTGKKNYLTGMQKLQKFLNAPLAHKMYVPGGNAIESNETDMQAEGGKKGKDKGGLKPYNPETGEGHYIVDGNGFKRYFESDGKGGFHKNADGSPKLLDPLHHDNPKAQYMKKRISQYLDSVQKENADRREAGKPEIMPKVVVKSGYTTFGTDIVDNVIKELQNEHPELMRWNDKLGGKLGAGSFTGEATDREETKTGFRGNKNDYANNQGHLWATTVSPAGKEGVDFGNAHYMVHYDQDYNPQKMAQFTARVRRSDSKAKGHDSVDRANAVRVESMHMPGTVEDFMFNMQDAKMKDIQQVTDNTRAQEEVPKYGETAPGIGRSHRGFTRGKNNRAGAKPGKATPLPKTMEPPNQPAVASQKKKQEAAAKAFKLVVLL